ncbi:MAG: AAA family ATPase [Bacteroidales bacterium]|nr:AAA family ATPase [Bacteroidales bacterium]
MPNFFEKISNSTNKPLIETLTNAINIQQKRQDDDYKEMMGKPLHERVSKGHTLANLDIMADFYDDVPNNFCPMLPGTEAYIHRVTVFCGDNVSRFRAGAPVILSHGRRNFKMYIDQDLLDRMVLASGDFDVEDNHMDYVSYPRHGWEINEDHLTINQELLMAARNKISINPQLCRSLDGMLKGTLENTYSHVSVIASNNSSQDTAVRKALGCSHFHLIQGPPGTGKTYTIARIVKQLLRDGRSVFVTGPTHTAINNCLNAVSKLVPDKSKIVKIGEKHNAEEILSNPYVTRKTRLAYQTYEYSDLSKSGIVIGSTPYALCYPISKRLAGWDFDYVIIDEAAQMSIPLALAAMASGKKVIFVGDHKQLDPIMPSGTGNWLFDKSIFKHLVDKYPGNVTMLDKSYRLSESLVRIPTALFYNGRLSTALAGDNREYVRFSGSGEAGRIINARSNEVLYLHHEFDALGRSPFEAKLSADIVDDLTDNGVELKDIAVITPYRAQVREVKKALVRKGIINENSLDDVFVDTIERMQGQEKDYVIFTLANSNPSEVEDRLEFFYSPNRLNVAITRAKTKCIVIANEKVFQLCKGATANNPVGIGKKAYLDYYQLATKVYADNPDEEEW